MVFFFQMNLLEESERHAVLMMDEIQLAKGLDFDPSTGMLIGRPTVPLSNGKMPENALATHGLVFMLGGLSTRWKQTVAYELTENSFHADTVKDRIVEIIAACESIGIKVHALISDMGSCNQAVWNRFGLRAGKGGQRSCSVQHPHDRTRRLYFLADVPHLLKNLRGHLTKNQTIYLPAKVVEENNLPTNKVSLAPIEEVIELEEGAEFKIAPRLTKASISPKHFDKMKVGPAYTLFHHDTAAALRYYVEKGELEELEAEAVTTAWFVDQVQKWFVMLTSRTKKDAMMHQNPDGVKFLESFILLFQGLAIGSEGGPWKPIQTGVLLSTRAALELQESLLQDYGFLYVLLSRLSQDALENFFSTIRLKNPTPKPKDFKSATRSASLSQFLRPNPNGSYSCVEGEMLVGINSSKPRKQPIRVLCPTADMLERFVVDDAGAFEYLCGYIVGQVKKNFKTCSICAAAMCADKPVEECSMVLQLKSYLPNRMPLVTPTAAALEILRTSEAFFWHNKEALLENRSQLAAINKAILKVTSTTLPGCHGVPQKLTKCFLRTRVHLYLRKLNEKISEEPPAPRCGSKSIGMREAARAII